VNGILSNFSSEILPMCNTFLGDKIYILNKKINKKEEKQKKSKTCAR